MKTSAAGASPSPDEVRENRAVTRQVAEELWVQFPGHFNGALSKQLVSPQTVGSRFIDHRISCYEPGAYVECHVHRVQEQVYHVLSGEGVLTVEGERRVVRANDVTYIPPGIRHGLHCTGTDTLVFLVITSPPDDEEAPPAR